MKHFYFITFFYLPLMILAACLDLFFSHIEKKNLYGIPVEVVSNTHVLSSNTSTNDLFYSFPYIISFCVVICGIFYMIRSIIPMNGKVSTNHVDNNVNNNINNNLNNNVSNNVNNNVSNVDNNVNSIVNNNVDNSGPFYLTTEEDSPKGKEAVPDSPGFEFPVNVAQSPFVEATIGNSSQEEEQLIIDSAGNILPFEYLTLCYKITLSQWWYHVREQLRRILAPLNSRNVSTLRFKFDTNWKKLKDTLLITTPYSLLLLQMGQTAQIYTTTLAHGLALGTSLFMSMTDPMIGDVLESLFAIYDFVVGVSFSNVHDCFQEILNLHNSLWNMDTFQMSLKYHAHFNPEIYNLACRIQADAIISFKDLNTLISIQDVYEKLYELHLQESPQIQELETDITVLREFISTLPQTSLQHRS